MTKANYSGKGSANLKERGSYVYDYRGLLIKKTYQNYNPSDLVEVVNDEASKPVTEFYEYAADGKVIYNERSEDNNTKKTTYIWANTTLWCEVNEGLVYYHHTDHLGTTEVVTDSSGAIVWEASYEAFGSVLSERGESKFTPSFTGKFFDKASGLYYFNARWYDSELGKFTSSDPIRDGLNWWNYCNGNPIVRFDFTGLESAGYSRRQGDYDLLPKLQGIDTGDKWYNNLWDGFVSYCLEGTYNLLATGVNTITNGIGATNELANMACEAVFGADIDSITITLMANGMIAPLGYMLNGFNTYMNGLKLMNTSKVASTALSTVQVSVNVGAGLFNIDPLPTSANKFYVAPNGDCLPAVGYRYMDSSFADLTMEKMSSPGSYISFNKYDSAADAMHSLQINPIDFGNNCKLRGEFDTLQVFDEAFLPTMFGNKPGYPLEPYTKSYPMLGPGGVLQYKVPNSKNINFSEVKIIGD